MARRISREVIERARRIAEEAQPEAVRANREAALPVLEDLSRAGFAVDSIGGLVDGVGSRWKDYKAAVPVLLRWLPVVSNADVRESIVRMLAVKWARPEACRPLVKSYRRESSPSAKWAIANSLEVIANDEVFDEIVGLVTDKSHGKAREMLAMALGNMKTPEAVDVLIGLLDDEEVAGHAIIALGKLRAQKARPHVERFLTHSKTWVRREAKRALEKIDKAAQAKK